MAAGSSVVKVSITGDARDLRRALDQADRASKSFGDNMMGTFKKVAGPLAIGAAATAVARFGASAVSAAAEVGESVNAVQVVFGDAADTILDFSSTAIDSLGLTEASANQAATVLGSALQNSGMAAEEAAEKTIELSTRAADMASVFNTDVADALGAIQAALRGESDPIERFGVSLSAVKVEAEAAALGFQQVGGEFDETAKMAARMSLIMKQTERVAGDYEATADSVANTQKRLNARWQEAQAEIGEGLLPVASDLMTVVEDLIPVFVDLASAAADSISDGLGPWANLMGEMAGNARATTQEFEELSDVETLQATFWQDLAKGHLGWWSIIQNTVEAWDEVDRAQEAAADSAAEAADMQREYADGAREWAESTAEEEAYARRQRAAEIAAEVVEDAERRKRTAYSNWIAQLEGKAFQDPYYEMEVAALRVSDTTVRSLEEINEELAEQEAEITRWSSTWNNKADDVQSNAARLEGRFGRLTQVTRQQLGSQVEYIREWAEAFEDNLNQVVNGFSEAPDEIDISLEEFQDNLVEQQSQIARWSEAVEELIAMGFTGLAQQMIDAGPASAGLAEDFVADVGAAATAEATIQGDATGAGYLNALNSALSNGITLYADSFRGLGKTTADLVAAGFNHQMLANPLAVVVDDTAIQVLGGTGDQYAGLDRSTDTAAGVRAR